MLACRAWSTTGQAEPGCRAELCTGVCPQQLRDPSARQQRKRAACQRVTKLSQDRKNRCFIPDWRLKHIKKRKEFLKAWPRQIPPVRQERPMFLIYHLWQGMWPECKTRVIISRIKQWEVLAAQYRPRWTVWDPPCDPENKAMAGSGAVLLALAVIGNKNTEAFLILQRQKWNPSPLTQCLPFLSRDQINMGPCKVNGLFQGVLNGAL